MQSQIWASTLPLHITSPNNPTPYLINFPRQSYLSLLLPRLSVLYDGRVNTFQYESILLKNLPLGLLYDLYGGELPWKLEVVEGPDYKVRDAWLNSLKEAEFLRTGSARGVMSLSRAETESLWDGIVDSKFTYASAQRPWKADRILDDVNAYNAINNKLLNSSTPLKHIPLRVYVPNQSKGETVASFKPIQTLVVAKNDMRELYFWLNRGPLVQFRLTIFRRISDHRSSSESDATLALF